MNTLDAYLQQIADFTAHHPSLGFVIVFLLAFGESIPVLGVVAPGTSVILAIATFAGLGYIPVWLVLVPAIIGAIAGDGVSYWFGHRYRTHALQMWPMSRYPELIVRSERFFAKHGAKSILIARFTPVVRAFVPMIAGISGMHPGRFYRANVLSALAWAFVHVLPAAALGASLAVLHEISGRLVMVSVAILLGAVVLAFVISLAIRFALSWLAALLGLAIEWLKTKQSPVARAAVRILGPDAGNFREVLLLGAIIGLSVIALYNIAQSVLAGGELVRSDHAISGLFSGWRTAFGDNLMIFLTALGDTAVTVSMAAVVAGWMAFKGQYRLSLGFLSAMVLTVLFVIGLKGTMQIARPSSIYSGVHAFSFPSGHVTQATALYGILSYVWLRGLERPWRMLAIAGSMLLISTIAFSRIYLQAHWPSDVMAGLVFGICMTAIFALAFRNAPLARISPPKLAALVAVTLVVVGGGYAWSRHHAGMAKYAQARTQTLTPMTESSWRDTGWQQLPERRIDLVGETEEPIILQWAGTTSSLERDLSRHGWHVAPSLSLVTASGYVSGDTSAVGLPALPRLHDGRAPVLTLVHETQDGKGRRVLHVWQSTFSLSASKPVPILIGAIFDERMKHPFGVVSLAIPTDDMPAIRLPELAKQLPNALTRSLGQRTVVLAGQ